MNRFERAMHGRMGQAPDGHRRAIPLNFRRPGKA